MNCHRVSSLMSAYVDGELTGYEMLEIRRHLEDCQSCMLQHESLRRTKQLLSRLKYVEPSPGLIQDIYARLDTIETPGYQRVWQRVWHFGRGRLTPVTAGCVALGATFVFLTSYSIKEPVVESVHPASYAAASILPARASELTPAEYFSRRAAREEYRPLVPQNSDQPNNLFQFASLAGP